MTLVLVCAPEEGRLPLLVGMASSLLEAGGVVLRHLELGGDTWEDDVPVGGPGDGVVWAARTGGGPGGYYLDGRVAYEGLLRRDRDGATVPTGVWAYGV